MPRVIALTGATGFIGAAVMHRLQSAGFRVRALYRANKTTPRTQHRSVRWIQGSLEDAGSLKRLLSGAEGLIHCAGAVRGSEWRQFKTVNTDGVARMVQAARQMHPSPRFLLLSSLAAREPKLSWYAASKHLSEEILKSQGGGLKWVVLRPPAVYGPGDREIAPLLKLMGLGLAPQATPRNARFSMIYIDDLVEAIVALTEQTNWDGSIYELHDGRPGGYDWCEVVQTVSRVLERPICRFRLPHLLIRSIAVFNLGAARVMGYAPMLSPGKVRELEHKDWTCDNHSIMKATGWHPRTPLDEGIKITLQYQGLI